MRLIKGAYHSAGALFLILSVMALVATTCTLEVGADARIPGHHLNTGSNAELSTVGRAWDLHALSRTLSTETSLKSGPIAEGWPRRSLSQLAVDDTPTLTPQVEDETAQVAVAASGGGGASSQLCNDTPAIASAVGGFAACTKVIRACRDKEARSSIQPPPLCSEELRLQCEASALGVAQDSPECWAVLNAGSGSCSPSDAAAIFDAAVSLACSNVANPSSPTATAAAEDP